LIASNGAIKVSYICVLLHLCPQHIGLVPLFCGGKPGFYQYAHGT